MKKNDLLVYCLTGSFSVLVLAVVCVLVFVSRQQKAPVRRVQMMTRHDLGGLSLALIKHPKCGHCRSVTPLFEQLLQDGYDVTIIDGTTRSPSWFRKNQVTGYPTICFYDPLRDSVVEKHGGPRTREAVLGFYDTRWKNREACV